MKIFDSIYPRTSTHDQNLELQLDALTKAGFELIYQEKVFEAGTSRPELDKLLSRGLLASVHLAQCSCGCVTGNNF